ncbi:MAG: tRNA (adenosine(37)-N6)-threonylcarbamoyltransferase complex dimerization subunit type 1 TsaB [Verrucomicrobium sp.]|nr:tRNA (adenosine(37)-N6)-threonylcarbamoyltransferase complex dimerization subunit type 1 TsaB [Verrucomicrobium sp.]
MITLAIETSAREGSAALGDGVRVLREERWSDDGAQPGKGRPSVALFAALEALDLKARPPERIVVGLGPGSFSGVRVALAAAQGLALPGRVPVRGVASTASVGRRLSHVTRLGVFADARRGDYYCTIYANGNLEKPAFLVPRGEVDVLLSKLTLAVSADPLEGIPERAVPRAADFLSLPDDAPEWSGALEPIYLREAA